MDWDKEMEAALIADGEKLRALTGEDHGPWFWGEDPEVDPAREIAELRKQLAFSESMRPHWAQGFTSDGVAAQVQTAALASVWEFLGVASQTDCMVRLHELREQLATARAALERISRWHGEFPPTGKFWENTNGTISDRPMQYGACYGSNGERDFMRAIAGNALDATQ